MSRCPMCAAGTVHDMETCANVLANPLLAGSDWNPDGTPKAIAPSRAAEIDDRHHRAHRRDRDDRVRQEQNRGDMAEYAAFVRVTLRNPKVGILVDAGGTILWRAGRITHEWPTR